MKDLLRIGLLTKDEIYDFINFADEVKEKNRKGIDFKPLLGTTIITSFPPTSLRTRVTFEQGIFQLGAQALNLPINFDGKEPLEDIIGYLNNWIHGLIIRHPSQELIEGAASLAEFTVINAMSKRYHPCEILSDLQTIRELRGNLESLKFVFVGEGANISNTWFDTAARLDLNLTQVCPPGYEISQEIYEFAKSNSKGEIRITHSIEDGMKAADIVLTDPWPFELEAFKGYQVNLKSIELAEKDCIVSPCPPFYRGNEISKELAASKHFIGYGGKENLLHMHKAILARLMLRL